MSDLANYPRQDKFETTLAQDLDNSSTTIYLSAAPSFSLSSGQKCELIIDYDSSTSYERCTINGPYTGGTTTIIGITRGNPKYSGGSSTATTHSGGAKVIIGPTYADLENAATAINSKMDKSGGTFSGAVDFSGATTTFKVPNLTTTERNALGSPGNGMVIYNTTAGEFQVYQGGSWVTLASGSTQPNGSTTVAGKYETSTLAEAKAGVATGGTGAEIVLTAGIHGLFLLPTGTPIPWLVASIPSGFVRADGSAISRTTYADLFALFGTTFGVGDGSTTFNVPDMRGRALYDQATAGTYATLGGTGGATTKNISHTHTLSAAGRALIGRGTAFGDEVVGWKSAGGSFTANWHGRATGGNNNTNSNGNVDNGSELSGSTDSGGSAAQDVTNPFFVVKYIIKT